MHDAKVLIVAPDHPSVIDAVDRFADDLRSEQRFFGRRATTAPIPSLINRLTSADGLRLGAQIDGRLVAMARVDHRGDTSIAVVADARGQGIGRELLTAALHRAREVGMGRLVLRSSQRSRSVAALGAAVGATTVDQGCGRVDFILSTSTTARTA
jgi:GNAT superfamily N-acetyltransferase